MALYDPNEFPEAEVSTDFTPADVLAWARTKPADEAYDYSSNCHCAIARFIKDSGRCAEPHVGGNEWWQLVEDRPVWHSFADAIDEAAIKHPQTLGAFAKRLESALA